MTSISREILLFLLSSVLVSHNKNPNNSSKSFRHRGKRHKDFDQTSSDYVRLLAQSEVGDSTEQRSIPPPLVQQLLDSNWTFWYDQQLHQRFKHKNAYLKELHQGGTFSKIPDFWKCWQEVLRIAGPLNLDSNFRLFKEDIKPMWEDPKNINGGKFTVTTPSSTPIEATLAHWLTLIISMIVGEFGFESEISGLVFSVRSWGNVFSIWNKNANDREQIEAVTNKLRELFGAGVEVKYQRHRSTLNRSRKAAQRSWEFRGRTSAASTSPPRSLSGSESSEEEVETQDTSPRNLDHTCQLFTVDQGNSGIALVRTNTPLENETSPMVRMETQGDESQVISLHHSEQEREQGEEDVALPSEGDQKPRWQRGVTPNARCVAWIMGTCFVGIASTLVYSVW